MTSAATPRKTAFRVIRWVVVAVVALILLPYFVAPLYRVINPVSTLMVGRSILGKRVARTWVPLAQVAPVLPGALPVLEWLQAERLLLDK